MHTFFFPPLLKFLNIKNTDPEKEGKKKRIRKSMKVIAGKKKKRREQRTLLINY